MFDSKKKIFFIGILLLIIALGITAIQYILVSRNIYELAIDGKTQLELGKSQLENKDLSSANTSFTQAAEDFDKAYQKISNLTIIKWIPFVNTQVNSVEELLFAGKHSSEALRKLTLIGEEIFNVIQFDRHLNYSSISTDQKEKILDILFGSENLILDVFNDVNASLQALEGIPYTSLVSQIREVLLPIENKLPVLREIVDSSLPLIKAIPGLVGYPETNTYLFLLQNHHELRPTGGFIGTYGIIKVEDGDLKEFYTDNVYNLDLPVKDSLHVKPPAPLAKYLGITQWFFRDSNWAPDFAETARKATWFYHAQNGPEKQIDGVVAITPVVAQRLLSLVGNITVDGIEFTKDNLVDKLENRVGKEFYALGIPMSERKEVVGKLGKELKSRLLSLPQDKWLEALGIINGLLNEKHILVFTYDTEIRKILRENNWDGKLVDHSGDYFMVVDTNLGSLKSDAVINRNIYYQLRKTDSGKLIAKVTIEYLNEGHFTWKTTRLRTYTRVYVPEGSQLISSEGLMDNDRTTKEGKVKISREFGKTVFEGFIAVEPQKTGKLTFEYELPDNIKNEILNLGLYNLYVQKQPGTIKHGLYIDLNIKSKIKDIKGDISMSDAKFDDQNVLIESNLLTDRNFELYLK